MSPTPPFNIAFVLEQALGHVTHSRNLQKNVPADPAIRAHWCLIPFETQGWAARIPLYRSNWTVRAGLRARRALATLARRQPLGGLFIHSQVPGVLAADWARRYPTVVSLDATPMQYDELGEVYHHTPGPAWLETFKYRLNVNLFREATRLVAWTQWTKDSLVKDYGVPPDKVTVIPPGVNTGDWQRPAPRQPETGAPVKILFVGGDLARKGGDLLLEVFRAQKATTPAVELHLVTKTPLPPEPGVFVYNDLGPNDPRLIALYHQADLFALPTLGDCLPMVLSEAGAAGLPCVSTRVAGIPEIVLEGETGLLMAPRDGRALSEALSRLVADAAQRQVMGHRAVEIVGQRFDAVKNAERLLALIKDVVAKEGKR
ncbi:MAG: glycosyltransferase family 4 protein [Anaerolineales bacterium]|nr:glycosyltransferase family 4 protein [Anaerolineales bacterium]